MKHPLAVLALAATTFAGPAAHADPPQAAGFACEYSSTTGLPAEDLGYRNAELSAGPVLVADLPAVDDSTVPPVVTWDPHEAPSSATIECGIQVNSPFHQDGATEDANDRAQATATGTAVVVLPSTHVVYATGDDDTAYVCTEWTLTDGVGSTVTLYLDDDEAGGSGEFVTDPAAAHCAVAVDPGPEDPDPTWFLVDSTVCPIFALAFPPEGDIAEIWDCPPYDAA